MPPLNVETFVNNKHNSLLFIPINKKGINYMVRSSERVGNKYNFKLIVCRTAVQHHRSCCKQLKKTK